MVEQVESGNISLSRTGLPRAVAYVNLTSRCNNSCVFCAANVPLLQPGTDLSLDVFSRLEPLIGHYDIELVINGGEPTIHPELIKILEYWGSLASITLFTNGRRLADRALLDVVAFNVARLSIPFYTSDERYFDRLTGSQGSFTEVTYSLEALAKLAPRPKLELKLLLLPQVVEQLQSTVEFLSTRFLVPDEWVISGLIPSSCVIANPWLRLSDQEFVDRVQPFIGRHIRTYPKTMLWGIPLCALDSDALSFYVNGLNFLTGPPPLFLDLNKKPTTDGSGIIPQACLCCSLKDICKPDANVLSPLSGLLTTMQIPRHVPSQV